MDLETNKMHKIESAIFEKNQMNKHISAHIWLKNNFFFVKNVFSEDMRI